MVKWWREWREILDLWRGLPQVLKAQRLLGRARRHHERGEATQGYRLALEAFAILRSEAHAEDPAARSLVATDAVLLHQLAKDLGHERATREDLVVALQICEEVAGHSPRLEGMLQQHMSWYRHRLSEIDDVTVH